MLNIKNTVVLTRRMLASPFAVVLFFSINIVFYTYLVQRSDRLVSKCGAMAMEQIARNQRMDIAGLKSQMLRLRIAFAYLGRLDRVTTNQLALLNAELGALERDIRVSVKNDIEFKREAKQVCENVDDLRGRAVMVLMLMNLLLTIYAFWAGNQASRETKHG